MIDKKFVEKIVNTLEKILKFLKVKKIINDNFKIEN